MAGDMQVQRLRARIPELARFVVRADLAIAPVEMHDGRDLDLLSMDEGWQELVLGEQWGGADVWAILRLQVTVPLHWRAALMDGTCRARVVLDLNHDGGPNGLGGSEAMIYIDGLPFQGLDPNHRTIDLDSALCDGMTHQIVVQAYSGPRAQRLAQCQVEMVDRAAEGTYYDLFALLDAVEALAPDSGERSALVALLVSAEQTIDRRPMAPGEMVAALGPARALLAERLAFVRAAHAPGGPRVLAVGHAHIDTAWLWPLAQTRRKVARSWSTAVRFMDRFPSYRFLATQAQQYAWIQAEEPHLFGQIADRIASGQWEAGAAMWVEPDVLITSGESLVRQLLFGQRYLRETFGRTCRFLWLPDTFGYSPALPQVLLGAGVDTFITSKISWNETNQMPHDLFAWRGLDGSEVLTWFITTPMDRRYAGWPRNGDSHLMDISTYNGALTAPEIVGTWQRFREKALTSTTLCAFGFGDGGGGPTATMLELAERFAALPGVPTVQSGTVQEFVDQTRAALASAPVPVPVWDGELYLEYHRGTYTSQGWIKRANRWAEHLYHDAEVWAAWASLDDGRGAQRMAVLNRGREIVLRNQFHDILPGSSIAAVYSDARREHAEAAELGEQERAAAQATFVVTDENAARAGVVAFNGVPVDRDDPWLAPLPVTWSGEPLALTTTAGEIVPSQVVETGEGPRLLVDAAVPALGYRALTLRTGTASVAVDGVTATTRGLENRFFRLDLNEHGVWSRLFDKRAQREALAVGGGGNQLTAFEDRPIEFDAWDINAYYADKPYPVNNLVDCRVVEAGPVRATIRLTYRYRSSTIQQSLSLYANLPRIDIETTIDWHERQTLLKAAFPLAVRSQHATYECAFGYVERPTHRNTSWDAARFEVPAHRWADLSENGYGVSLLNDGKYGHDCLGHVLSLTLLKSAIYPDPLADEGHHRVTYALYPHGAGWDMAQTVGQAYLLNLPPRAVLATPARALPTEGVSLVRSSRAQVVLDTVKPAEDGDGLIVRLYDCARSRGEVTLTFCRPVRAAAACNLLEDPLAVEDIVVDGATVRLPVAPFQIRSLRVRLEGVS